MASNLSSLGLSAHPSRSELDDLRDRIAAEFDRIQALLDKQRELIADLKRV